MIRTRRYRQPSPASKTRRAARWLATNPALSVAEVAAMFGCYAGAIRTAWVRMYPGISLRRRVLMPLLVSAAVHRCYIEAA